jgi:phospholipid/cholesterol/gamma-HCH transport system ATP-binding protein
MKKNAARETKTDGGEAPVVVRGLRKSFGDQKVLNGIDLTAERGETVAVLGRSGTGKSVLLKLLVGLQQPDQGSIRIEGQEITSLDRIRLNEVRKKIGFLFQQAALYDSMRVEENVEFPLKRHTKLSTAERRERVRDLLAKVEMEQEGEKMPSEISGGMQKRVGLARALALDPEILLFDEPTAGLDPITAAEIGKLISQLQQERKMTSIVVTHDVHGAKSFCDRLVLMREGEVLVDGSFEDLEKSRDPFVVQFLRNALR